MTATEVSGPSAANVVFRLDCDQLSRLYYTDDNSFRYRTVVGAAGSLKGAFVSFDASTGSVDSIVTFTKRPQAKWQAGRLMLTGGENLAVAMPVTGSTRQPSIVVE